jgi:predicted enzyme related to lactoylglutathione lyase
MTDVLKRTTFVVGDADSVARRYEHIFGWTRYYDERLAVDYRFPPIAPDGTRAHLIMLRTVDPKIGMLGLLSYEDFDPPDRRQPGLGIGSSVLVVECEDVMQTASLAKEAGGLQVVGPVEWLVPGACGSPITLRTVSIYDPDGLYWEVSQRRS